MVHARTQNVIYASLGMIVGALFIGILWSIEDANKQTAMVATVGSIPISNTEFVQ
ncbi:hypothetical protein [Sulfoacidibacillus ferrooxidans]|uniref:Uncharacterized protein n=1 Tax=Sulfoacidibacillus ferrooxidans TaxID=2005001 RepID=A0A9X1VEU6_9BACL|nr:hypothetical protein [Sulfoacidibacillus ferrooxidans]MCI0184828.1 hypothetical protein [Sulfoacidibacillus ferrooxidans]